MVRMPPATRRIRIGIDTGGTFTDVVALDEDTGEMVTTKTPSTPGNPADGFMAGIDKVLDLLDLPQGSGDAVTAVSHGTTVATNQLLEGKVEALGYITTAGYDAMLEIARQSVPDGYGNSYFWVKPPRIVPRDLVRGVEGRLDFTGAEVRPFDEEGARRVARWFRARGIDTLGVCFLHSYANPDHEERMRAILREEHPDAVVSLSSEVLREYREYERAMTTLVDAAVKPRLSRYVTNISQRLEQYGGRKVPFYVMKSNGGVLSADEVVNQPITTVLSGPAAGALGAALIAQVAGFDRVLTSDGGGTSTDVSVVIDGEPTLTTEGSVGAFPSKIPMIDVVTVGAGGGSIAWLSPEGTLKVGPQSAGADPGPICYAKGGAEVTITDAHVVLGRIPPHLLGGEIPLDVEAARAGIDALASRLGMTPEACANGVLEISAWNQANALAAGDGQAGARRPRLHAHDVRWLRLAAAVPPHGHPRHPDGARPAQPGQRVGVRAAHRRRQERLRADPRRPPPRHSTSPTVQATYDALTTQARDALDKEGFDREVHRFVRTADVRYFGQAFEVRVGVPDGPLDADAARRGGPALPRRAPGAVRLRLLPRRLAAGRVGQPAGLRDRADHPARDPQERRWPRDSRQRDVLDQRRGQPARLLRDLRRVRRDAGAVAPRPATGPHGREGRSIIEEFGSTVPVHPGFAARIDDFLNIIVTREALA